MFCVSVLLTKGIHFNANALLSKFKLRTIKNINAGVQVCFYVNYKSCAHFADFLFENCKNLNFQRQNSKRELLKRININLKISQGLIFQFPLPHTFAYHTLLFRSLHTKFPFLIETQEKKCGQSFNQKHLYHPRYSGNKDRISI